MEIIFSPGQNKFFPVQLKPDYENAGTWPADGIDVSYEVYLQFTANPPEGKARGVVDGMPAWVDKPLTPNSELLKLALKMLNTAYQNDIEVLNRAWLAAAVNDGVNETSKKDAVLVQINARKATYSTDKAEVIARYPV